MTDSLDEKKTLLSMANAFRTDTQDIQQRGAGYYSCDPFVSRYNKLLAKAHDLFDENRSALLDSFDEVESMTSVDPADKMKVTQRVLIELGQLIAFMKSVIAQEEQEGEEESSDAAGRDKGENQGKEQGAGASDREE